MLLVLSLSAINKIPNKCIFYIPFHLLWITIFSVPKGKTDPAKAVDYVRKQMSFPQLPKPLKTKIILMMSDFMVTKNLKNLPVAVQKAMDEGWTVSIHCCVP